MLLASNEKAVADFGYRGKPNTIDLPDQGSPEWQAEMALAWARHESCNNQFKKFAALKNTFRHSVELHQDVVYAIAVITQLRIENGETLFDIDAYGDN